MIINNSFDNFSKQMADFGGLSDQPDSEKSFGKILFGVEEVEKDIAAAADRSFAAAKSSSI
jgi:hypothetical protein